MGKVNLPQEPQLGLTSGPPLAKADGEVAHSPTPSAVRIARGGSVR
jgi:hypothetical protein